MASARTIEDLEPNEKFISLYNFAVGLGLDPNTTAELITDVLQELDPLKEIEIDLFDELLKANNILIAGATGSGKSVLLNGFIVSALEKYGLSCMFAMIDPKRVELASYKKIPQTVSFTDDVTKAVNVLDDCLKIIENRYKLMTKRKEKTYSGIPFFIIVDEFPALLYRDKKPILDRLQNIARICRASNTHLICCSQDTTKAVLQGVKGCLSCKVALKVANKQESRNIIGVAGAETLPRYGMCILDTGIEQNKVKVPYTDDNKINEVVNRFKSGYTLLDRITNKVY